jgi:hypothetical protein
VKFFHHSIVSALKSLGKFQILDFGLRDVHTVVLTIPTSMIVMRIKKDNL